jgi:beta-glucanase (GH16 family)
MSTWSFSIRSIGICGVLFFTFFSSSSFGGGSYPQPTLVSGEGTWVYCKEHSDDFSGNVLNKDKWDNDVRDWGKWSWEPQNAFVRGGFLHLEMQYHKHVRGSKTLYYTSGIVKSKEPPVLYGFFEARVKGAPRHPGVAPAFWAFKKTKNLWTEIDFFELTQRLYSPKTISLNTHVFRHPSNPGGAHLKFEQAWTPEWKSWEGFHTYGVGWNKSEIRWYIDGRLVATRENRYWHQALDVVISLGLRRPLLKKPETTGFPTEMLVDYVRVWKKRAGGKCLGS